MMTEKPVKRNWAKRFAAEQSGLTLIEVMISFVVLCVAVFSAMYALGQSQRVSMDCRKTLMALNSARSTLEVIKNTPLTDVPAIPTAGLIPAELPSGTIAITTNPANLAAAQSAVVTVTVTWRGSANRQGSLQVTTVRSAF